MFFRRTDIKELDTLLQQFQMNQENNYKDAAQEDFQKLAQRLEEMKNQSKLKEKEYTHYSSLVKKYEQTLIYYSHKDQKCSW